MIHSAPDFDEAPNSKSGYATPVAAALMAATLALAALGGAALAGLQSLIGA